jgi:VWFA-related protein
MMRRSIATVLVAVASAVPASVVGQQVFRAGVDAVAVDVLVTRDKRPVSGLKPGDFILRDAGVEQRIQSVMLEDVPVTLLLALDVSGSVRGELLDQLKSAVKAAAAALRPSDRVGLIAFNERVHLLLPPPANVATLGPYIGGLEANGDTAVYDAAFAALSLRERALGRMLLLVFSDGLDTTSWLDPRDVLTAAQRSDVVVHAVVAGPAFSTTGMAFSTSAVAYTLFDSEPQLFGQAFFRRLVEDTGGSLHQVTSRGLRDIFVGIVNEFRSRYVLTYVPEGVAQKGWHEIEVKLRSQRAQVVARRGYLR